MRLLLLIFITSILWQVQAQTEVAELSVHLKNDDILTGTTDITTIAFKTDFGTLNLPIDAINSIDIGLTDGRFDKGHLLGLLEKLENGNEKEREKSFDEIVRMEEGAIPFIKAYLSASTFSLGSEDLNIQTLYEVMLAKHKISPNYSLKDILIYNNEFRVEGMFAFDYITLSTDYGNIQIERNDIARLDVKIVTQGIANKNTFKLFANQHISGKKEDGWLNTGILVKKGDQINIRADGQIVLASLSGNIYFPDGGVNGSVGAEGSKPSYGQVVFKIGQNGEELKAGDSYTAFANQTGIIYLAIFESVFNTANSGYYTIDLNVTEEKKSYE